jgi:ferritin
MPNAERSKITRKQLIDGLNEDLSREYQAIISYVNYSQVLKGAAYMNIADELAVHAKEELARAEDFQSYRLPWRHVIRHAQAREDVGQGRGYVSI